MKDETGFDGFLAISEHELGIARSNKGAFQLARRVNRECHRLIFGADVKNRDLQAMLVSTLFLRALQHYQSVILLLQKGLVAAGRVSLRAELETVFAVRAVAASDDNLRAYVNDDLIRRLKLMRDARKYEYPIFAKVREAVTDQMISELEDNVRTVGAKQLFTSDLSKMAGLHDLYLSVYSFLSSAVHSGVRELDSYMTTGEDGEIKQIEYLTSLDDIGDLLLTAADFILLGSDAVARQFEIDFNTERRDLGSAIAAGIDF